MTSRAAISRLLSPPAASNAISRSRGVSSAASARGDQRRRPSAFALLEPHGGARGGAPGAVVVPAGAVRAGGGVGRLGGHEQRVDPGEALRGVEQRRAVVGHQRLCMRGRQCGERAVDLGGETGELGRGVAASPSRQRSCSARTA